MRLWYSESDVIFIEPCLLSIQELRTWFYVILCHSSREIERYIISTSWVREWSLWVVKYLPEVTQESEVCSQDRVGSGKGTRHLVWGRPRAEPFSVHITANVSWSWLVRFAQQKEMQKEETFLQKSFFKIYWWCYSDLNKEALEKNWWGFWHLEKNKEKPVFSPQ